MARYMFRFMEERHVKALLVACNTISCVIGQCEGEVSCPTFNAVQAGAEAAARLSADKIGVISTVFTHNSRCYPEQILARSPKKLVAPGGRPGGLTIYTTGGVEEYALRARQVGLERIGGVSFYPPMAL